MAFPWQVIKDRQQNQEREVSKSEKKKQRRRHIQKKTNFTSMLYEDRRLSWMQQATATTPLGPFPFSAGLGQTERVFFLHRQKEIFFPTFAARELSHLLPPLGGQPLGGGRKRTHQKHRQK